MMKHIKKGVKYGLLVLAFTSAFFLSSGCGTLLHPERRGQNVTSAHNLDIGIVVLDGIGLFFFLIPGLIAYAIDISNGTIYAPPGFLNAMEKHYSSRHNPDDDE